MCSIRTPVRSRGEQNHRYGPSTIDLPRAGERWACLDCTCLKIQSSASNVLQHWRANHRRENGPITHTDDSMRQAALSFQECVKRSPERSQIIEMLWKESEDVGTMKWYKGRVTSVKPNGARVQYDDQEVCVHDFHIDGDEKWRPWAEESEQS